MRGRPGVPHILSECSMKRREQELTLLQQVDVRLEAIALVLWVVDDVDSLETVSCHVE